MFVEMTLPPQDGGQDATQDSIQVESMIAFYDKVEIHPNCTVQVLTNTKTGDVSVGWWRNDPDEEEEEC